MKPDPEAAPFIERATEYMLYASRWLLVPIFAGLIGLLLALIIKFYQEIAGLMFTLTETAKIDVMLKTLTLVDMALVASLLVMVAISGYENFVSRLDSSADERKSKPSFFSRIDPGTIKIKLAMSIVAISSINLLQVFLSVDKYTDNQVMWKVIVHVVFIFSALATAIVDAILSRKKFRDER